MNPKDCDFRKGFYTPYFLKIPDQKKAQINSEILNKTQQAQNQFFKTNQKSPEC